MKEHEKPLTDEEMQILKKYHEMCHAIQSGVAFEHQYDPSDGTPKHLRTGINLTKCDHAALVELLIEHGAFTRKEYFEKLLTFATLEVERYQKLLSERYGNKITLA